jgi:hypothetical protein
VVFTNSSVSPKTIASMDLSPNCPVTHLNVKHPHFNVNSRKYTTEDMAVCHLPSLYRVIKKNNKSHLFAFLFYSSPSSSIRLNPVIYRETWIVTKEIKK